MARQVSTSTRELARKACRGVTHSTHQDHEAIAFELERATVQGSQTILSWLDDEGIAVANREQIIELASAHLAKTDQAAENEQEEILRRMLFDEVGRQSRPGQIETDRNHFIPWSALRLALWILRGISDVEVRARAFELARGELSIYRAGLARVPNGLCGLA